MYSLFTFERRHNLQLEVSEILKQFKVANLSSETVVAGATNARQEPKPLLQIKMRSMDVSIICCLRFKGNAKHPS